MVLALLAKGADVEAADWVLCVRPLYRRCVCVYMRVRARICVWKRVYSCAYTNSQIGRLCACVCVRVCACVGDVYKK